MRHRNLKLGIIALLSTMGLTAQDLAPKDVPSELRTTFEQAYPQTKGVEWEKEGDNYKVEFEIDREDREIWYSADGKILKAEKKIKEIDLPQAIRSSISDKYAGYKIDSIEMTEKDGSTTYKVELEKKVVFDSEGMVLSESRD